MSKRKSNSLWNVSYSSRDPTGLDGVVFRTMPCLCSQYRHCWWTSWDYLGKVFESDPIPREKSRIRPQICRQAWKKDHTWPRRRHWGESGKVWSIYVHVLRPLECQFRHGWFTWGIASPIAGKEWLKCLILWILCISWSTLEHWEQWRTYNKI